MEVTHSSSDQVAEKYSADDVLGSFWDGNLPVDPSAIAEAIGIEVRPEFSLDGGASGKIELLDSGAVIIYFDRTKALLHQRFTVAHEIGHFACGHFATTRKLFLDNPNDFSTSQSSLLEIEANNFAMNLLIPSELVRYVVIEKGVCDLERLANLFSVSELAMDLRLKDLGIA